MTEIGGVYAFHTGAGRGWGEVVAVRAGRVTFRVAGGYRVGGDLTVPERHVRGRWDRVADRWLADYAHELNAAEERTRRDNEARALTAAYERRMRDPWEFSAGALGGRIYVAVDASDAPADVVVRAVARAFDSIAGQPDSWADSLDVHLDVAAGRGRAGMSLDVDGDEAAAAADYLVALTTDGAEAEATGAVALGALID